MIFAEGNQRDYMYQKHSALTFLNNISVKEKVLIAYHGAAAGEISALFMIKYLEKRKIKEYLLFNFAELRNKEFEEIQQKIKTKKIDKLIILEGFGLPECYEKFNGIAINIDSHFNDKEPIKLFLNPVAAKFSPVPSVSLVMYDLLKDYIPEKFKWLVAASSILDYNSEAAQLIIQDCKDKLLKFHEIKYSFWSCQYVEKAGNSLIAKLLEKPTPSLFETDKEIVTRKEMFLKKINEYLMDLYKDKLIFIVEKFKESDDVRISTRYGNPEVNLGKICQKLSKEFDKTDAIGYNDTASFRTKKKYIKPILEKLKQYC